MHGISQRKSRNIMPDHAGQVVLLTDKQLIKQVDFLSVRDEYKYSENHIASLKNIATSIN